MKTTRVMVLVFALVLMHQTIFAQGERVSLFNGRNLDGWTVIKCEAEVVDGSIMIKRGNGLVQTENKYADFVLEFDWKPLAEDEWDSGIYFRYNSVPENSDWPWPWPKRYQANLKKGMEGNVGGIEGATSTGLIKDRDWNTFKLTVQGSKLQLEINGKQAWKADGLEDLDEGFIAIQAEEEWGGQHLFRNIYVTELK